jgi:hypothetical protein
MWMPPESGYNLYPAYPLASDCIELGFPALARRLAANPHLVIDGMAGVLWDDFRKHLSEAFKEIGVNYEWFNIAEALRSEAELEQRLSVFLGGDDPLFGSRNTRPLKDFFLEEKLRALAQRAGARPRTIRYGTGAALAGDVVASRDTRHSSLLVYVDLPKNEIQFRARAGAITNLGVGRPADPKLMYKRFYFVDWPALRPHQAELLPRLDIIVDAQRPEEPAFMSGEELRIGLRKAGRSWVRPRPWFEPGPWGGKWMKQHFPAVGSEAPNLAWSFELISPENGIAFESSGRLLEVAFDWLTFQEQQSVLGDFAARFGWEFPIRFDYLDTFDGGNLSVQCHPRPEYA